MWYTGYYLPSYVFFYQPIYAGYVFQLYVCKAVFTWSNAKPLVVATLD